MFTILVGDALCVNDYDRDFVQRLPVLYGNFRLLFAVGFLCLSVDYFLEQFVYFSIFSTSSSLFCYLDCFWLGPRTLEQGLFEYLEPVRGVPFR